MSDIGPDVSRRRAVFLDVDGTYAVHGAAPAGHVAVVRAARDAGNLVFLCTGRPLSMLPEHLLDAGFDGLVAAGGAYALLGDEVLLDIRFPADLAALTVAVMDGYGTAYLLERSVVRAPRLLLGYMAGQAEHAHRLTMQRLPEVLARAT